MATTATQPKQKQVTDYLDNTFFQWSSQKDGKAVTRLFLLLWVWDCEEDTTQHYVAVREYIRGSPAFKGKKWPIADFNKQLNAGILKAVSIISAE